MSKQSWEELLISAVADGTAVANTTTETLIFPATTIPANYMADGRTLHIRAFGKYSTTATPTLIFGLRWGTATGGVLICKTAACTLPTVTNAGFDLDIILTVRSNGSVGTIMGNGVARVFAAVAGTVASATGEGLVTPMMNGGVVTPAVATCDFTADTALSLTATWSAASASNTLTGLNHAIESMN